METFPHPIQCGCQSEKHSIFETSAVPSIPLKPILEQFERTKRSSMATQRSCGKKYRLSPSFRFICNTVVNIARLHNLQFAIAARLTSETAAQRLAQLKLRFT